MKTLVFKAGKKTLFELPISDRQYEVLRTKAKGEGIELEALLISLIRKAMQGSVC